MQLSRIKRIGKIVVGVLLGWFLLHCAIMIIDGAVDDTPDPADLPVPIAIVYGNKVNEDGTLSKRLKARCDKAIQLKKDKQVEFLFVSGGLGKEGHYEGDKMRDYMIEEGIERASIIVDNEGNNSYLTGINAARIMRDRGWESAYVVSSYYHLLRCRNTLKKYDHIHRVYGCKATMGPEWRDIWSIPREFLGFYQYQLRSYEL